MTDEIVDGAETPLGQHQRWMRHAPDLFEKYMQAVCVRKEASDHLAHILRLATRGRVKGGNIRPHIERHTLAALALLAARDDQEPSR